ncbi:MAG: hypothetical protein WCX71_04120 [Candidatus Buchananbacteria bacterium]
MSANQKVKSMMEEIETPDLADPFSQETRPVEQAPKPESLSEQEREHLKNEVLEVISESEKTVKNAVIQTIPDEPAPVLVKDKSETQIIIEDILSEDLRDVYFKMDPPLQQKFKTEGENISAKIEVLLKETKVKTHKIFKLIFGWLKLIPGVNKFFINQEAKLKAEKIIKLNK